MILRGILDESLGGFTCIRGFACLDDLEKISEPDFDYQRDLNKTQRENIEKFYNKKKYLFFPEIILSYTLKYDFEKKNAKSGIDPLKLIRMGSRFDSNVDNIRFYSKKLTYKQFSSGGKQEYLFVTVEIESQNNFWINDSRSNSNDSEIKKKLFMRVDGNHRLSAAAEFSEESIKKLPTPFCLLLFPDTQEGTKFDKVLFHNINSKSEPLTPEEHLRIIIDDYYLFDDEELKSEFGYDYYLTRLFLKKFKIEEFSNIQPCFGEVNESGQPVYLRTTVRKVIEFLIDKKIIQESPESIDLINDHLNIIDEIYGEHPRLRENNNYALLAAFLFYSIKQEKEGDKLLLFYFNKWVISKQLFEIQKIDANSIVNIYEKILVSNNRKIFVSMDFRPDATEHYCAIKKVVHDINKKYDLNIKLREIRMDMFNQGYSYKIDDKILELIEDHGLLIADLTFGNKNVYQELGYLMGLNRGKGLDEHRNFILIMKKGEENTDLKVGFNLRAYQQIRFENIEELEIQLMAALLCHYNLEDPRSDLCN